MELPRFPSGQNGGGGLPCVQQQLAERHRRRCEAISASGPPKPEPATLSERERTKSFVDLGRSRRRLLSGLKAGSAEIPAGYLHDFYASREPPPSTRIWIVATTRRDMLFIDHRTISVHASDADPPSSSNAFSTLLGIGHLGFYLLNWTGRVKPSMERFYESPYDQLLIPIFPCRGPIIWPPRKAFTKEGFNEFGDVFGGLEGRPPLR